MADLFCTQATTVTAIAGVIVVAPPTCSDLPDLGVTSNIPSSWTISGPQSFSGSGTSGTYANVQQGSYSIYNIPPTLTYSGADYTLASITPDSTQSAACASNVVFAINYTRNDGGPPPGGNTGTVVVNTNRSDARFQLYKGNGGLNPYGTTQTGNSYTYMNVPAPDTYQLTAEVVAGITPVVTPTWGTLTGGGTLVFNVYYGGCSSNCGTGTIPTGTVTVNATMDGAPISTNFLINYSYGGTTGVAPYTLNNQAMSAPSGPNAAYVGTYTATYVSGGPANSAFLDIQPSASQTVAANANRTFTFRFVTSGSPAYGITFNANYVRRPLNPPTNVTLDNSTCRQVAVSWSYADNGVGQYFTVWRSTNPTTGFTQVSGNLGIALRAYADPTVTPNTAYYYLVKSHTALGTIGVEEAVSPIAGPVVPTTCTADMYMVKDVTHVNGAAFTNSTRIQNGDTLRFRLILNNLGPSTATIQYVCLDTTANLTNFRNMTASSGTNGGITGAAGNCVTARLNVSGTQTAADPNWVITYEATVASTSTAAQDIIDSDATLYYTDPEGAQTRTASFSRLLLLETNNSPVPDFREVGP